MTTRKERRYPIFSTDGPWGDDALRVGCNGCGHQWLCKDVEESMFYVDAGRCPECRDLDVYYVYEAGVKCPACGKTDFSFPEPHKGACSRLCMLQAEYLAELEARKSAAS